MRFALLSYCVLAIAACVFGAYLLGQAQSRERSALGELRQQLAGLMRSADDAKREMLDLEEQQRLHRADFTPQQAVQMSVTVQDAQAKYADLLQQATDRQKSVEWSEDLLQRRQVWFVPLIGFGLLHIFGIFYFSSPERKPRRARRAR